MAGTAVPASIAAQQQDPQNYQAPASIAAQPDWTAQQPQAGTQPAEQQQPQQQPQTPPAADSSMGGADNPDQGADGTSAQQPGQAKHGFFGGILNAVANALGGPQTVSISRGQDGSIQVQRRDSTAGEKWGRILQSALTGTSAALAQPSGPGQLGRAAGASIQAGQQQAQQQHQQATQDANQNFDAAQKAQLHNAQMAAMAVTNATSAYDLTQKKAQAFDGFLQAQNAMHDLITANPLNRMIGNTPDSAGLVDLKKTDPNVIKDWAAGKIKQLSHINSDGSYGGVDWYHVEPEWQKQMNSQPLERRMLVAGDKVGDPPKIVSQTLPANSINNGDYMKLHAADEGAINLATQQKFENDNAATQTRAKVAESYASAANSQASAAEHRATTANLQQQGMVSDQASDPQSAFNTTSAKLANGELLLSDLPKRTNKGQPTIQDYVANADRISKAQGGKGYDPAIIHQENTFANNDKTQAYFGATGRLVAPVGGAPALLDQLVSTAKAAGLSDSPMANEAIIRAATNPAGASFLGADHLAKVRAFVAVRNEVQRSLSTAAGNPLIASSDSDIKLHQMEQTIGSVPTLTGLASQVGTLKASVQQERNATMQNNRFLMKRYGQPQQQQPQQQPQQQQPQQQQPTGKAVSLQQAMAMPQNRGRTPQQVSADIQAHGHMVIQ
jgi:hypothetical protein